MGQAQTCPRRVHEMGPWDAKENLDIWETGRWSTDEEEVARRHAAEDAKLGPRETIHRTPNSDLWLWNWGPPRTCSFCGCIHPEDAIKLLSEGWEIESTTKWYKRYMHPPGTLTRNQAFLASIKDTSREVGAGVPSIWSPVPPVKLHVPHFDEQQLIDFNSIIDANNIVQGPLASPTVDDPPRFPEIMMEITCAAGHTFQIAHHGISREVVEANCAIIDGTSPMYKHPPGADSMIGRCGHPGCTERIKAKVRD